MNINDIDESIRGFYANPNNLKEEDFIFLEYYFITNGNPYEIAAHLCQEQSTAQYKRVNVDEDFRKLFGSKVVSIRKAQNSDLLCGERAEEELLNSTKGWLVKIAYPHRNFGPRIPNLMTAICGEGAFHSPGIIRIKLMDIHFPDTYLSNFCGPEFGIKGLRDILQIYDRPIFLGVIKPNIGLPPEPFGELAYQAWLGGLDIAKEDELLCDMDSNPFIKRTEILGKLRLQAEKDTCSRKIYLANITDEVDRMLELYDIAINNHVNAVMINGMTTGLSAVRMLAKKGKLPLFSHFDFIAPYTQVPNFGIHLQVIVKLQRLAGFDCIIYQGLGERMGTSKEEVLLAYQACVKPMGHLKSCLPVPGGSQWVGSLNILYELFGTIDFGIVPGRAVFSHPMGPKAGALALRQGWEAIRRGIPFNDYAIDHPELKEAIINHESPVN